MKLHLIKNTTHSYTIEDSVSDSEKNNIKSFLCYNRYGVISQI